jgi:hypothetical protein
VEGTTPSQRWSQEGGLAPKRAKNTLPHVIYKFKELFRQYHDQTAIDRVSPGD